MNGFLLIDKPEGITSFAVVARVRRTLDITKVGHCGTLDPLATGLLIICLGKATKLAQFVSGQGKSYIAELMLGATSTTYDRDGELTPHNFSGVVSRDDVAKVIPSFVGEISQQAPAYSALKHQGRPLYDYARRNVAVEPKERKVFIQSFDLIEFDYPRLTISVSCSSGTYIRSLAHDLGTKLGCGGYVANLRRTRIGNHRVTDAIALEDVRAEYTQPLHDDSGTPIPGFVSIDKMLSLPAVYLTPQRADDVGRGVPIRVQDIVEFERAVSPQELVALRNRQGNLLAVGRSLYASTQLNDLHEEKVVEYIRVI